MRIRLFMPLVFVLSFMLLACQQMALQPGEVLFVGDDPSPHGPLHVTHVYMRGAHGWRLVSRHASAADDGHQAMADAIPHTLH